MEIALPNLQSPISNPQSPISNPPGSDAWWFFTQCAKCGYELAEGQPLQKGLRWSVSPAATVTLPDGTKQLVHDDRLFSAALSAAADNLYQSGKLLLSLADPLVIPA